MDLAPWWALFYLALTLASGGDAYPGVFLLAALGVSVISAAVIMSLKKVLGEKRTLGRVVKKLRKGSE